MEQTGFKTYDYRWVVLLAFMAIIAINQLLWITFAAITTDAMQFYRVSELSIGLLSLIFMVVYIFASFPASWVIDTYGIRVGVGIGAVLTGVFGLVRGLMGHSYTWVLVAQIAIAIGQPFILNAVTTIAARWFPINERATASGIGSLAIYLGILLGLVLTPYLTAKSGIASMLTTYGIASLIAMLIFFLFARERPPSPPCPPDQEARSLVVDGLTRMIRQRDFILLMVIFFVGLGAFNAITTWIEQILTPNGFTAIQAGDAGGAMIFGGILGAVILPLLSDHFRKRVPFLVLAVVGAAIGMARVTGLWNVADLFLHLWILPLERRPDRVSIWCGDHVSRAGRYIQWSAPAYGTNLGHPLHPWHGRVQVASDGLDDDVDSDSHWLDGAQPRSRYTSQRSPDFESVASGF